VDEIWKAIPGFEGSYEASDQGRIRSLDRVVTEARGRSKQVKGVVLKPAPSNSGHMSVVPGRVAKTRSVHTLVALTFLGPPPPGHEVLHRNHTPADNRLANLKYGTRSQNLAHDYETGNRCRAVPVIATEADGTKRAFRTITESAMYYGLTQPAVTRLVQANGTSRKLKVRFEKCSTT